MDFDFGDFFDIGEGAFHNDAEREQEQFNDEHPTDALINELEEVIEDEGEY